MNENPLDVLKASAAWRSAYAIQRGTLHRFYELSQQTLRLACTLKPLDEHTLSMERNLFSTLFILTTGALELPPNKTRFYALVNQCLRTLVTGCDNLLDDEYKEVVPLDIAGEGTRFRSVLQIMTADAVVSGMLAEEVEAGRLDAAGAARLTQAVLAALVPSGIQEHEEESNTAKEVPRPSQMLQDIHYRKTGLLFQAPIRVVQLVESLDRLKAARLASALARFGLGCQILDDVVDVAADLANGRYNLVLSMAYHGAIASERDVVRFLGGGARPTAAEADDIASRLERAAASCHRLAEGQFSDALRVMQNMIPQFEAEAAESLVTLVRMAILKDKYTILSKTADERPITSLP